LKRRIIFFVVLFLFAYIDLMAQNPFVSRITTSDGLPSDYVYKIFQDSKKFLWFATEAGVARFDGTHYTYFRKKDGLSSNDVFEIREDSFGRIWFFHINASIDFFLDNTIHNVGNTPFLDSLKTDDFFKKFYEDKEHNIYFYSNSIRQIFTLDPHNHVTRIILPGYFVKNDVNNDSIEAMDVRYMTKNDSGVYILGSPGGFYRTNDLAKWPVLFDDSFRQTDVITSSTGELYAIGRPVNKREYDTYKLKNGRFLNSQKPLPRTGSDFISSILEDNSGLLWISTYDKGVFCYRDDKLIRHLNIKDAKMVIQDHENNIWVSSLKEGVYKINPFFNHQQHFEKTAFQNNGIYALAPNDSLGVWFTNGDILYLLRDNTIYNSDFQNSENSFNQILQVSPNSLLIGETSKYPYSLEGVRLNRAKKTIKIDRIKKSNYTLKKIVLDSQRRELISFNQFSLYHLDPENPFQIKNLTRLKERINNVFYNPDHQLIINAKKNYIFERGILSEYVDLAGFNNKNISGHLNLDNQTELYNIEGESLFLLKDKMICNLSAAFSPQVEFKINGIAFYDSTLFIASSRNIFICENPLNVLNNKPVSVYMVNVNFRSIHSILFHNKKLFVASDDGLTSISIHDLQRTSNLPPIPYFQSIQVNDQGNQMNQPKISLLSSQKVSITFNSINYSVNPVYFSYLLEGGDTDWTLSESNNVVLQNLSKGNYTFKLRVRKPSSEWSIPIEFKISVKAPQWQNPLFIIFSIGLLTGLAFLLILRQKNIELRRRELEHQLLLSEQKSLQAMMNPHFIFNTLGSIQNYLLHNKPYEAGIYLSKFARLIRQNFNALNTPLINLDEEVDRLKNYLELERLRTNEKFDYTIVMDESIETDDVLIPSMIIQPFVENAVWHGIANLEGQGVINIKIKMINEKSLEIKVSDTGIGIKNALKFSTRSDHHLQLGMNITLKRLNLLSQKYKVKTAVSFTENSPGSENPGVIVTIIAPFVYGKSGELN